MHSNENVEEAIKACTCCPTCSDFPCEGSLNWDGRCEKNACTCDSDSDRWIDEDEARDSGKVSEAMCTVCREIWVDVMAGEDTCPDCK